jgi:signal transduction histidine kinase
VESLSAGTTTLDPGDDPELAWPHIRDLGRAGGLAALPAARLAIAVTTMVGQRRGPTVVDIVRVEDAHGAHVKATIHGGNASSDSAPPGLVDSSRRHISSTGTVTWVLTVNVRDDVVTDPALAALDVAAARSMDTRELLLAVLAAVARQASRAKDADCEVRALRLERDQGNQRLLAVHAELAEQQGELQRARVVAGQVTRDKAVYLAQISHEIRSPMNAIVGFTGLLRSTALTTEQAEYTQAVETAGKHLLGLIDGILDLSKIESGLLDLENVPFDLFACVEDAVDMLAAGAAEKKLPLAALFGPTVPARIVGDPLRLRQILVSLLANAVKFTTHGQVVVEVTDEPAAGTSRTLAFRVADTGVGIPDGRVEQIFAPYAQADASTPRSHGGTGLGLPICRVLAELMGGAVTADSVAGQGSTFTCTIPARVDEVAAAGDDSDLILSGTQILVVNGQALYAEAIGRHLTDWGAEVVTATSVDAAVSRSGDWPRAALAIIDASRPAGLAGDVARISAASANPALPVICVAAMASRAALASTGELWPSVRTPVRRDHLRKAVLAALGLSSLPGLLVRGGR